MAMAELTSTMRRAVEYARKHGGELERYPGGYWCEPGRTQWNLGGAVTTFGTSTIAGLVGRGAAEYVAWKDGRNGNFPIRVRVTAGVETGEVQRLRAEQAAGVMPQIGPLLDAWDGMDNDTKEVLREEAPDLARALVAISRAMDGNAGVSRPDGEGN
jgi:hypothetical protein